MLIGKLVTDFLFVLIDFFSLDITAEALRPHINWKSTFLKRAGQFHPNSHVEGDDPHQPLLYGYIGQ